MKNCLECNVHIVGRSDKKFCSYLCRNSYNNKTNSINNKYVQNINTVLKRNRKILEGIVLNKPMKINKEKLEQKGFSFQFHTDISQSKKGTVYYCYDYGYVPLENNTYFLVKKGNIEDF